MLYINAGKTMKLVNIVILLVNNLCIIALLKIHKMKKIISAFFLLVVLSLQALGQQNSFTIQKFVLDNGFTVILNPDPHAVGVYGAVVIKAGSKNDPADATGMAHYL